MVPTQNIQEMIEDGRAVSFRHIGGKFIVTAIPIKFEGGPVPDDWRAESDLSTGTALNLLSVKWRNTPNDFNWDRDDG